MVQGLTVGLKVRYLCTHSDDLPEEVELRSNLMDFSHFNNLVDECCTVSHLVKPGIVIERIHTNKRAMASAQDLSSKSQPYIQPYPFPPQSIEQEGPRKQQQWHAQRTHSGFQHQFTPEPTASSRPRVPSSQTAAEYRFGRRTGACKWQQPPQLNTNQKFQHSQNQPCYRRVEAAAGDGQRPARCSGGVRAHHSRWGLLVLIRCKQDISLSRPGTSIDPVYVLQPRLCLHPSHSCKPIHILYAYTAHNSRHSL